jgi:ketosteroid isomerase-like protein|tara:strand:- start:3274 stop:3822 length:549 start_codon:yes stop_codon:yes gene_type:complete
MCTPEATLSGCSANSCVGHEGGIVIRQSTSRSRRPGGGRRTRVLAGLLTTAIALTAVAAAQSDDEVAIRALERAQADGVVEKNYEALERIYAEDFVFTHGTGEVHDTAQWIAALRAGRDYQSREHEALEVELHDDLAVVYGVLRIEASAQGRFRARYVRVYQRRDGRWRLVSHRTVEQTILD